MCDYCKTDESGDSIGKWLFDEERDCAKQNIFAAQGKLYPKSKANTEFSFTVGGVQVICATPHFNYCPMCGRKL